MIKKIYDRDTGNIYDVGADNKLKLVAEGQLIYNESDFFELPYQLENGKYYSIHIIRDDYCLSVINGVEINNEFYSSYSKNNEDDGNIALTIFENALIFYNINADCVNDRYKECSYKIYELPFSM